MIVTERPYLDLRIWLRRYGSILLVAIAAGGLAWLLPQTVLFKITDISKDLKKTWAGLDVNNCLTNLQYYAPGMLLYDFLISLTAIAGLIILVCMRAWSRLSVFSLLWLS